MFDRASHPFCDASTLFASLRWTTCWIAFCYGAHMYLERTIPQITTNYLFAMLNPFSTNSAASAWGNSEDEASYLFNKVHIALASHLEDCTNQVTLQTSACRLVTRAHPAQVMKLWEFVHPESILKFWNFEVTGLSRTHSATLMKCLQHYVAFVNKDWRLVLLSETGKALGALYAPLHRFDGSDILPVGSQDATGAVLNLVNKTASYEVWLATMRNQFPAVPVLESVTALDISQLSQMAVFPMRIRRGTGNLDSFTLVFVPAFRPVEENREIFGCKKYTLGFMVFGCSYEQGGGFDETFTGYFFAVPSCMVKSDSNEPFFFRTCRTFKFLNRDSNTALPVEGTVSPSSTHTNTQMY